MKHLHDDMNELFQRAANGYPLRNSESEWNTIAQKIQESSLSKPKRKNHRRYAGLVFLFLSAGMLLSLLTQLTDVRKQGNIQESILNNEPGNTSTLPTIKEEARGPRTKSAGLTLLNEPKNISSVQIEKITLAKEPHYSPVEATVLPNTFTIPDQKQISEPSIAFADQNIVVPNIDLTLQKKQENKREEPVINSPKPGRKKHGFFAGIVIGPQINQVKGQGIGKLNTTIGILGGYRFTEDFSIETGLLFSRKQYFSDGKYFRMKNPDPAMPSDMKVLSLQSCNNVFEIPVKLRYDVLAKKYMSFFSSVGISSYILTREKNDYITMLNGNRNEMTGNYRNTNRYVAAALNISIGYESKISRRNSIRLEPYIQVPIKGIGVGSMPVTSAGLHIGITWSQKQ